MTAKNVSNISGAAESLKMQMKQILILFISGSFGGIVLNILQMEYQTNFEAFWWVIPCCGLTGVYLGICYPYIDHKFGGQCNHTDRDWTFTIRCTATFFGLNHMCAKIIFSNSSHLLLILIVFCAVFWFWFDKTWYGFVLSLSHSIASFLIVNILRYIEVISYTETQFIYLQICLICLVFSGCICFANIGRLLDFNDVHDTKPKNHAHID